MNIELYVVTRVADLVFSLDPDPVFKFLWIRIGFQYPDSDQDPRRKSVQKLFQKLFTRQGEKEL